MKKYLLSILFAMFGIVTYAQTEPAITLTVEIDGNARNLVFAMTETGHKLQIDWGDGKLVETEEIAVADEYGATTTVTGSPPGKVSSKSMATASLYSAATHTWREHM